MVDFGIRILLGKNVLGHKKYFTFYNGKLVKDKPPKKKKTIS